MRLSFIEHAGSAVNNTWYTPVKNERSFIMLCSGIQYREPTFKFINNKLVISTTLDKNPLNISEYCDNRWQELIETHPKIIEEDKAEYIKEKFDYFK